MPNEGTSESGDGAVGEGNYEVKQGDCISSIASESGHSWETIWNHPANSALKSTRKDPNVLFPGDQLFIPELRTKDCSCSTGSVHKFQLKSVPVKLRLQIFRDDKPRKGERFQVVVDKHFVAKGKLDGEGKLDVRIPPSAKAARVFVGEGKKRTEYSFDLGCVDPLTSVSGVQQRLRNLGFYCETTGQLDDSTITALAQFQQLNGLEATGQFDDASKAKLLELHGS